MHATCSLFGVLLAFAPVQGADDKGILGKDDLLFARELIKNGYSDLAERLCTALEKHRANVPGDMLGAQSTRVDIKFDQAWREPDLKKRKELLQSVLAAKNEFVTAHSGAVEAADALDTLPDLVRFLGDTISALLEKEEDAAAKDALRKEAAEVFGPAESLLRKQVGTSKGILDKLDPGDDSDNPNPEWLVASDNYLVAFSSLARTYYFHSIVLDASDPERAKLLEQVIEMFDEIELDFAQTYSCFDGFIFRGLALKSLGKSADAIASFDAAIRLREVYQKTPQGIWPVEPESANLISNAVLQKMLALKEQGDHPGAIATATDFLNTVQGALKSVKGIRVLMALADEYEAAGDGKNRDKTASRLIEVDPTGSGGQRGREILGGGGPPSRLGAENALQLAGTFAAQGEQEKAIQLCQQILTMIRGTPQEQNHGAETCLLLGALYAQRSWLEEAAVAWDTAAERYPKGAKTPDALWRSINCYLTIWGKTKRGAYEKMMRSRIALLTSDYPKSPNAEKVALIEVQRLENDEKFLEAAAVCEKIDPSAGIYPEALFRAGNCYYRHARKLVVEGKTSDARPFAEKAVTLLKKAMVELEAALKKTLDEDHLARQVAMGFSARMSLAGVYLLEGVSKPAEVLALFEGIDRTIADDASKLGNVWDLRFRALRAQGKMADALKMLDEAVKADPKAKGIDKVALSAGKEFDTQAIAKQQAGATDGAGVDELFKKAQTYYMMAMAPQLDGREQPRISEMEAVAGRLVVIGLHFNRVPKEATSFIEWTGRVTHPEAWEQARTIYEALLPWSTSSRILTCLATTNGWLGKWKEAATAYARIFDGRNVLDPTTKRFTREALAEMPELPYLYVEWGTVEHRAALGDRDNTRYERAITIFISVLQSSPADSKLWWQAKYAVVRINVDKGSYEAAKLVMRDIERNTEGFDGGKFGFKEKFEKVNEELKGK